jgi:predicted GH43/DUF377 family glycosyl hydrolase
MSLAVRHHRIMSRGHIPGSDGGIYNPGAVKRGSAIVLLCRREIDYRFSHVVHPECLTLDAGSLEVVERRTLRRRGYADDARIEDFRSIDHRGEALVIHTQVRQRQVRPVLARIVDDRIEIAEPIALPLAMAPIEKNWVLFEHDGALHCLYQLDPLTVLVRRRDGVWRLVKREDNGWADGFRMPLSNSANLIPFMDGYLGFWHSVVERRYVQGALLLDRDFRLRFRTGILLDGGMVTAGYKPGVLYVSALVEHERSILAFYGEGDAHTSVAIFDASELAAELRRHPFVAADAMRLRYSGVSLGDLYRAMTRLQQISRERGAPHLWLHLDDSRLAPIVSRFGIRNLSVRALPKRTRFDHVFGQRP